MKLKRKHLDILLAIIFIIFSILLFFLYQDSNECLGDPLVYGAEQISSQNSADLMCDCRFTDPNYVRFSFDKEGIEFYKP